MILRPWLRAAVVGLSILVKSSQSIAHSDQTAREGSDSQHAMGSGQGHRNATVYENICLKSHEDVARLASLLPTYLQEPDQLSSLKVFTFAMRYKRFGCLLGGVSFDEIPVYDNVTVQHQDLIEKHAKSTGLPDNEAKSLVDGFVRFSRLADSDSSISQYYNEHRYQIEQENNAFAHTVAAIIILTSAENLETLYIEQPSWDSPIRSLLIENRDGKITKPLLQNLKHIHVEPEDDLILNDPRFYRQFNIFVFLSHFHHLPKVESITANAIIEDDGGDDSILYPHTSNLKSISVTHSALGSFSIAALIRVPKMNQLREFHYTNGGRAVSDGSSPRIFPKTIGKALETQKLSLEILDIDVDDELYYRNPAWGQDVENGDDDAEYWQDVLDYMPKDDIYFSMKEEDRPPVFPWDLPDTKEYGATVGSFADFVNLKKLRIGVKLLLGPKEAGPPPFKLIEALPSGLEELELVGYRKAENFEVDQLIKEFIAVKDEKFPSLLTVRGIDRMIPAGHSDYAPDEDQHKMWQDVEWNHQWVAAQA